MGSELEEIWHSARRNQPGITCFVVLLGQNLRTLHRLNRSIDLPLDLELFIGAVCTIYKGNKLLHFHFKLSSAREPCGYLLAILSEPGFMSHKFSTTRVR